MLGGNFSTAIRSPTVYSRSASILLQSTVTSTAGLIFAFARHITTAAINRLALKSSSVAALDFIRAVKGSARLIFVSKQAGRSTSFPVGFSEWLFLDASI